MKAIEFEGALNSSGQITVPPEVARQLPHGESLHIVLQWDMAGDDAWSTLGRQRFEAAYADEDAVYEQLMDDAARR